MYLIGKKKTQDTRNKYGYYILIKIRVVLLFWHFFLHHVRRFFLCVSKQSLYYPSN